jgi:pimeloyl-ACP methyl ester carboxylesterase
MPVAHRLLSRPYRLPAEPFSVRAADGVVLVGHRVGAHPGSGSPAMVFCHGFLGWHTKARLVPFQEELARWFTVYAFDFRGHGGSGGDSTFGATEILDVDAVVRLARSEGAGRVVTLGSSMGGIAVTRHAALLGGIDGTVAISTPASWDGHDSTAIRRMVWLTGTPRGRSLLRAAGTRVSPAWRRTEAPVDVVDRISPIPLLIVHGRDDHFFDEEQAWMLYRRAGEPKRLLLWDRFGHAEDGYSRTLAGEVARVVQASVAP